jgi:hypothetical protein
VCYSIYLSTDADLDLSRKNSDLVQFRKEPVPQVYRSLLRYPNQWYVGSKTVCSCTFRHLHSIELGFCEPQDWYPEDEQEIEATLIFIMIVRALLNQGYQVDCIDTWEADSPDEIKKINVNLDHFRDDQFRFYENHHFIFTCSYDQP